MTQTVKDIRAASAQDLGKRDASEKKTLCLVSALDAKFKDLPFLSEAETSETSSSLIDAVVAAMKKLQNQQEEVDSPVEEKTHLRFITHLTMKIALPSPPMKRQRSTCALA